MKKHITVERIDNVIIALLLSPNQSTERFELWKKLNRMRELYAIAFKNINN